MAARITRTLYSFKRETNRTRHMRFLPETEKILLKSGWQSGRSCGLGGQKASTNPFANAVIEEFGGLTLGAEGRGVDNYREIVDFTHWKEFEDGYFDDDDRVPTKYSGLLLVEVASITQFNNAILIDQEGAAYIHGDFFRESGCYKYPNGIDRLLEQILLGMKFDGSFLWSY